MRWHYYSLATSNYLQKLEWNGKFTRCGKCGLIDFLVWTDVLLKHFLLELYKVGVVVGRLDYLCQKQQQHTFSPSLE